uniref:Uncharacterized protein n=1 Tax=Magallana gigas TaxID=29159 RepID=K1PXE8_MAGGI
MSQSQSGFLETVVGWDSTKCQENLDTALPRLIVSFGCMSILDTPPKLDTALP